MIANKYLIPIKQMIIEGQPYWLVEIPNKGQFPYFSYDETFYPNNTITEK